MRTKLLYAIRCLSTAFLLLWSSLAISQIFPNAPEPADNPNIAGEEPWFAICASDSFNEYFVNFTWAGSANNDNEFILELSDASGNFGSPTELARVNDKNTSADTDFDFVFMLPTNIQGEGHRMRVRSTSPATTSDPSAAYPMYYIGFSSPSLIREQGKPSFGDGTAQACDGNPITLELYNVPDSDTYQYIWFDAGTPISGETGPTLSTSTAGMYYVIIDYGSCSGSGNTQSNTIVVTAGISTGIAINPPAKTALCAGETVPDLEANMNFSTLNYTWFKDGVVVQPTAAGAYTYTIDTDDPAFPGDYTVQVAGVGICTETSVPIGITNAGNFTVTRDNPANLVLLPGLSETLSVSTTATSPLYQWYRDGSPIGGATNNTLNVTQAGTYYAEVSQSGGACTSTAINSDSTTVVSPASFELIAAYATAYTACENTNIVLEIATINAVASDGSIIDVTSDLLSSFTYQWKKDGVNVSGATSNTISLTNTDENGNYEVDGVLSTYNSTSNTLPVQLSVNANLTISSTSQVYCAGGDVVTISTAFDLNGETYEWQRNGAVVSTSDLALTINDIGTYRLVLSANGCSINSNEINIAPFDDSAVTLDSPENVVFPEGSSRTVTASGGTSYQWFDLDNNLMSSTDSMTFTEEGSFVLIATVGSCEVSRQLTTSFLDTFKVPNVITVNGDGINDLWIIPNSYSNDPEVNVIIYNDSGEEVFNVSNYQNNWPQSSTAFTRQNMVFFYTIRNAGEVLKRGTITIIR
ncbi:MAG: gliding motility-associated C-terminal domain-containing protein [Saonia sp.]